MEHIKLFWSKLNIPTLLQSCKENQHWSEAVFLYSHYDQFDMAVDTLIGHSTGRTSIGHHAHAVCVCVCVCASGGGRHMMTQTMLIPNFYWGKTSQMKN